MTSNLRMTTGFSPGIGANAALPRFTLGSLGLSILRVGAISGGECSAQLNIWAVL